jgi:hypothetical protein
LHPPKPTVQAERQGSRQGRFAGAWNIFQQDMSFAQQRDQQQFHDFRFANHNSADLRLNLSPELLHYLNLDPA